MDTIPLSAEVDDFARELLHQIQSQRKSARERARPMLLICHSLGGILFKQVGYNSFFGYRISTTNCLVMKALSIAHEEPTYRSLLDRFAAVAFMGTPHGGSDVASWTTLGAMLLKALSLGTRTNKELL